MIDHRLGFEQPVFQNRDWREGLRQSWKYYLVDTLGLSDSLAAERAEEEIKGSSAFVYCNFLESQGMIFTGKRILEIGSGHGTMAIEMAKRGGVVLGIEPCEAWRVLANARIQQLKHAGRITFVDGDAEAIPFADNSFDFIVSLQVLEHVKKPRKVINEIKRALNISGMAYVSCENYLAFREQHYKIPWLPLLPKRLGAIYLIMRHRNPGFLFHDITYTTYPQLLWDFLRVGLWSQSWPTRYREYGLLLQYALILYRHRSNLFRVGFQHFFRHK